MTKKLFRLITTETHDFVPENIIIIQDNDGLVYMAKKDKVWYSNSKSFDAKELKDFKKNELVILKEFVKMLEIELNNLNA